MVKLGKAEKKVLSSLLQDGRKSYSKIAKDKKLTRQTVHNAVKRLFDQGIVQKFSPQLDFERMGLDIRVYSLVSLNKRKDLKRFEKSMSLFKEVSQIHRVLGPHDYLVELTVPSRKVLTRLFERIGEMPEVEKMESMLVFQTVKYAPNDPVLVLLD